VIKYIGSKRELVPLIVRIVSRLEAVESVLDPFSGTCRVGHALKAAGFRVMAGDHNAYAHTLALCYVQADRERWEKSAGRLVAELNRLPGKAGYFTETFCLRSRFFQPKNGERIDAVREAIERKSLEPELKAVALTSLMEAADRVDSTTGVQMAYLKSWAPRAFNDLCLRVPELVPRARHGPGEAFRLDALEAASGFRADCVYLDPPYNQHSYLSNYHIWESLVLWDKPPVYGVACKRDECKKRRSAFNSKRMFRKTFEQLLSSVRAPCLVVSFNNEGYIRRQEMVDLLSSRGQVAVVEVDYDRYVGARIGIYNPDGIKVGKVSHLRNKEYVFVVAPDLSRLRLESLTQEKKPEQISFF
jgi:adenine-specific DNA-methyltransferase